MCNDDEDDVSAVIRAERVIVTEEGEEVTQGTKAKEEEVEKQEKGIDEEEREKQREEKGEEVREEEPEKEGEEEQVEEKEKGGEEETKEGGEEEREAERAEEHDADVQIHLEMSTEAGEDTEFEEGLRNNNREIKADADSSKEDTKEKIISQSDEETSEDTDTETKPFKDSATKSALNTDLISDADPAAVIEQETASAETPGGAVQTPSVSATLPASALNPNGAQKSPDPTSPSTNSAAQFQEIPLDGDTVEEEPLLATKAGPLTEAMNPDRSEGAKTKTCQCCTVM